LKEIGTHCSGEEFFYNPDTQKKTLFEMAVDVAHEKSLPRIV